MVTLQQQPPTSLLDESRPDPTSHSLEIHSNTYSHVSRVTI
jgi:hypothetical protein